MGEARLIPISRFLIWRGTVIGFAFHAAYVLVQFLALGILFRLVDADQFAAWLAILSISAWTLLATCGVPKAMVTLLSSSHAIDEPARARLVTGGLALLTTVTFLSLLIVALVWLAAIRYRDQLPLRSDFVMLATVVFAVTILGHWINFSGTILLANHRSDLHYGNSIFGQLLALVIFLLLAARESSLLWLGASLVSGPTWSGIASWVVLTRYDLLGNRWWLYRPDVTLRRIVVLGAGFVVFDICIMTFVQIGPALAALVGTVADVVRFGAAHRLIGLPMALTMVVAQVYWPMFGDAAGHKDVGRFRLSLSRMLLVLLVLWVISAVVIFLFGRPFVRLWLGAEAIPSFSLLIAGYAVVIGYGFWAATWAPLHGLGALRSQAFATVPAVLVVPILTVAFGEKYGTASIFWSQAAATALVSMANAVTIRHRLRAMALS